MSDSTSQPIATETPNESDKPETDAEKAAYLDAYDWMLRPCDRYKDEYKECKSFRGRFQQYFVYGESLNCDQWRDDNNNCHKWTWFQNKDAAIEVIKSEIQRRDERMKAHYDNKTWTKRDKPPDDWNKPLPDWMAKRAENSFMKLTMDELNEDKERAKAQAAPNENQTESACNIM